MTVTTVLRADRAYYVDGAGYQPQGSLHVDGNKVEEGRDELLLYDNIRKTLAFILPTNGPKLELL